MAETGDQNQDQTGNIPMYDNEGAPPTGIPTIDEGAVLLCIGMSQANDECSGVRQQHVGGWRDQSTLPVAIVNGGIDGHDVRKINDDPDSFWQQVEQRITDAGYTNADVQLIWSKNGIKATQDVGGSGDLMTERIAFRDGLILIQAQAEERFPNLRAGFHSSRVYGGFCPLNPEPFAYDSIFSIQGWNGEPGAIDNAPLWHLGPYLTKARKHGASGTAVL